jgi:O-antigen ligase
MSTADLAGPAPLWRLEVRPNYRQLLCIAIPVAILAYVLIIYPLGYYGQFVAADAGAPGPVQAAEPSLLNRIFFPLMAGLSVLMYFLERERAPHVNLLAALPLLAFVGYCGLSSVWAIDPSTAVSKFIVFALVVVAVVPSVAVVESAERYLRPMFWVAVATLLINLAFVLLTPPTPIGHAGIYSHKNSLGGAAAFCTIFLIYGLSRPERLYRMLSLVLTPIALYVLWRSQAKTALGLAVIVPTIGVVFMLARVYLRLSMPVMLGLVGALVCYVLFSGVFDVSPTEVSLLVTGDPTFTGRTDLWTFAVGKIAERPWLGYGFHSFWQVGDSSPAWQGAPGFLQRTPHAHEGYLDLLLQGGFVGLGLFAAMFLMVSAWISRATDESPVIGWLLATLMLYEGLVNLLETTWFDPLDPGTVIFLAFIATAIAGRPTLQPTVLIRGQR